jgi:hypothetical protein
VLLRLKFVVIFIGLSVDCCYFNRSSVLTYTSVTLDHYGSGGWGPPTPSSGPRWGPIPGSSSSTPGPPPIMDSPYRITCPVHSPYRFRFANGGLDYYSHQVGSSRGASDGSKTTGLSDEWVSLGRRLAVYMNYIETRFPPRSVGSLRCRPTMCIVFPLIFS